VTDEFRLQGRPKAIRSSERRIAVCFAITTIAAIALAGVYIAGGQPQAEGALLFAAFLFLGLGFVAFARDLLPGSNVTGRRGELPSPEDEREAAQAAFERGEEPFVRRSFLLRMLLLAGGALGLAALFPINSLGPRPKDTLRRTSWRKGSRVVTEDGRAVKFGDLLVGSILTVFPEGHTDDADAQTVLINVGDAPQKVPSNRKTWSVDGYVAYSKVCTHAGCPVGLYSSDRHLLLCPCHQSTFAVLDIARPIFGPAPRPLPQLPIARDENGFLVAQSDYTQPVGPGYWNRP
jgi:ubiquinol-cytochrome c reductase iron-sulfur subunit